MKNPITKPLFSFRQMLIFIISMMILPAAFAQGVSINNSNTPPDPSAMLDVESTTRGFLPPRLTAAQRTAVQNPASGLVVFDTDFNALFVMTGEGWMQVDAGEKWLKDEDNNLTYSSGNVGIGVPYPSALLHTSGAGTGEGNVLFMGEWKGAPGLAPASGPGTRMMWYPDKAAFRAGRVTGTQWDSENIGFYSTAFGFNSSASGWFSNAWGSVTAASGSQSTAWGFNSIASGTSATAWGENTRAPSFAETAFGYNNTSYIPLSATEWRASDRLFVIGNGFSGSSDALVLLKNGNMGLNTSTPTQRLEVAGSIYGQSSNWAIRGLKTGSGSFPGVWGETESTSSNATGVRGYVISTTPGAGSAGVHGHNFGTGTAGNGVKGTHAGSGNGVFGETVSGTGVRGNATGTTNFNYGVYGQSPSINGTGVFGHATAASGATYGVEGRTFSPGGTAGRFDGGAYGIRATAPGEDADNDAYGVYALSSGTYILGARYGGYFYAYNGGAHSYGIYAKADGNSGIGGYFEGNVAAKFKGDVDINGYFAAYDGPKALLFSDWRVAVYGDFYVSGTKSFIIDHPHDPANKYLVHYNLESPEPFNLYRGTVVADDKGSALVTLPAYFEDINIDFTYHLTPIGGWAPLYVARKIQNNTFVIAGGEPGMEVSWQVTATRNDAYVRENGYQTEVAKPDEDIGTYLFPEGHGQPAEMGKVYKMRAEKVKKSSQQ